MTDASHAYILDTISIDGAIRVLSDEFSNALLNPEQQAYRENISIIKL